MMQPSQDMEGGIRWGALARRIAYALGTALFIVSLVFVAQYARSNWAAIGAMRLHHPVAVLASAVIYGLAQVSTALAWPLALRALGQSMPLAAGVRIGLVAQIGKYLPGNVAHYVGRAAIAADSGISVRSSGVSTAVELLSAPLAAAIVIAAALAIDPTPMTFMHQRILDAAAATTIFTALLLAGLGGAAFLLRKMGYGAKSLMGPVFCLAVSFLLSGLSFFLVLRAFGVEISPAAVMAVFALAWVIGFVVPGAPAGLGVREAILIAFLSPMAGSGVALTCAIFHRLLTACVDMLAAAIGYPWLVFSKKKKSANEVLSRSRMSSG